MSVIKNNTCINDHFTFTCVTLDEIYKMLFNMNGKKATGYDGIPPKMVKLGAYELCIPVTYLVNQCIRTSSFPEYLKFAEITPICKKDDMLNKANYRPVSTLPCMSKIFEGVLVKQLSMYFEMKFSPHLSGFRKEFSCQSVLLNYVENCKSNLSKKKCYGSLLTDLSKAFDCLPHRLLIAKLQEYGVSPGSCMLVASYLQNRFQRVKIGTSKSDWLQISKGCPQGSLFGPLAYNIFSNDLLLLMKDHCDISNYADDTTASCAGDNVDEVIEKLQKVASIMLT